MGANTSTNRPNRVQYPANNCNHHSHQQQQQPNYGGYNPGMGYQNQQQFGYNQGFGPASNDPMTVLRSLDKDGNGVITENDFMIAGRQMGIGNLGEDIMRQVFKSFDRNGNGYLDYNEAMAAYNSLTSQNGGSGSFGGNPYGGNPYGGNSSIGYF